MHTTLTLIIVAIISFVVATITYNWLNGNAIERMRESCSKMWTRIQKAEAKIDRENRQTHQEFHRMAQGVTDTRSIFTTLTGYVGIDFNSKTKQIVATNKKGEHFLLDTNFLPAKMIPLKLRKVTKESANLATLDYKGQVFEYKKPVDTDF